MFINLSNHPHASWPPNQLEAAEAYGEIIDIAFPMVPPETTGSELDAMVEEYYNRVMEYPVSAVMLQGEMTFTFRLVTRLKASGICCLAGCSERKAVETVDEAGISRKTSVFVFAGFREY